MKRRLSRTPLFKQLRHCRDRMYSDCVAGKNNFVAVKECVSRQHQVLLGVGIFFLLGWIIASIWLVNIQRKEQGDEEVLEHQATISMVFPAEMLTKREMITGVLSLLTL